MVYHCTGCNDYGVGEAVYGLRVIHRHKLASPLTPSLGSEKKQRADTVVAAVSAVAFGIKDLPKHTLAILFFLVAFLHCNDLSHHNYTNRPSGENNAF